MIVLKGIAGVVLSASAIIVLPYIAFGLRFGF